MFKKTTTGYVDSRQEIENSDLNIVLWTQDSGLYVVCSLQVLEGFEFSWTLWVSQFEGRNPQSSQIREVNIPRIVSLSRTIWSVKTERVPTWSFRLQAERGTKVIRSTAPHSIAWLDLSQVYHLPRGVVSSLTHERSQTYFYSLFPGPWYLLVSTQRHNTLKASLKSKQ